MTLRVWKERAIILVGMNERNWYGEGIFLTGLSGPPARARAAGRLPPGQYLTDGFPVLSAGPTPYTPERHWDFTVVGAVETPQRWTWDEFQHLPREPITADIHCVTKWSKFDTQVVGRSRSIRLLGAAEPQAPVSCWPSATAATSPTCRWPT